MTPEQALSVLIQAAEKAHMPKSDHMLVEQAARLLADVLKPKEAADVPAPE